MKPTFYYEFTPICPFLSRINTIPKLVCFFHVPFYINIETVPINHLEYVTVVNEEGKPNSKWSQEAMKEGFSLTYDFPQLTLAYPRRNKFTLHAPTGRRIFSIFGNNPANEKLLQFSKWEATTLLDSQSPPMNFCSKQPLLISSFPLLKNALLLSSLDLLIVCHSLHIPNCNSSVIPE